ncbi:MAG: hypothetical protein LC730_04795 [Acidobacteria bacterium]|nr:hypothetical protein [Acidobacteriota bacterium]MCA1608762.1 hypothetical protein [Acidobacteriota bacterium]
MALDRKYIDDTSFRHVSQKLIETSRLISGFMNYLRQSEMRGSRFQKP